MNFPKTGGFTVKVTVKNGSSEYVTSVTLAEGERCRVTTAKCDGDSSRFK